jgi:hypothetical protein
MGLLDKVKESAGDLASKAKEGAGDLASKAKDEAKEFQLERDLGKALQELGAKAHELVESGAVSHPDLDDLVVRVRDLKEKIATLGASEAGEPADESGAAPADEPGAAES